jgi:hypothetical protein
MLYVTMGRNDRSVGVGVGVAESYKRRPSVFFMSFYPPLGAKSSLFTSYTTVFFLLKPSTLAYVTRSTASHVTFTYSTHPLYTLINPSNLYYNMF